MNDEHLNIRVGLAVLALLTIGVGLVFGLSGRTLAAVHEYHADFSRIGGLKEGATVRLSGMDVGKVENIRFAEHGVLRVDFWVKRRYRPYVRENSEFYVGMGGSAMLGEPTLEIGPPRGEPGRELPAGAVVRGIDPPRLDTVLQRLYQNLLEITEQFREQKDVIDEFLRSLDGLLSTLDEVEGEPGRLGRIRDNVSAGVISTLDLIAALRRGTDDGVRVRAAALEVSRLWQRAEKDFERLRPRIDRAMAGIDRLEQVFSPAERQRITMALAGLRKAADVGSAIARDVQGLTDYVLAGRGAIGGFLSDVELVDDVKQIHRMLKDKPWVALPRPANAKRE